MSGFGRLVMRILSVPKTIVAGVVLGIACGLFAKGVAFELKPLARIYIALLSMCMLPILISALIWGIGQMLRSSATRPLFGRLSIFYVIGLALPCLMGLLMVYVMQPGAAA